MRPDLIRLLLDTRRKEMITETNPDGSVMNYTTRERLGLHLPLDSATPKTVETNGVAYASKAK